MSENLDAPGGGWEERRPRAAAILAGATLAIAYGGCAGVPWPGGSRSLVGPDSVAVVETTQLPDVTPFRHFEPSIAADPDRPDRVLLASTRRKEQPFWTEVDARFSGDGGRTWTEPEPVLRHGYDRLVHGGGDPVALAGLDGRFHVATLLEALPAEPGGRRRSGIGLGTWERVGADSAAGGAARLRWLAEVAMYRGSERAEAGEPGGAGRQGRTVDVLRAPARTGGTGADKQWLAVDRSRGPRRGTVFAVWDEVTDRGIGRAMFGFSSDSGRTFRAWPLRVVPAQRGSRFFQIVVRPDAVIDLFWVNYSRAAVTRSFSRDGGISWSEPEAVSALAPVTLPNGAFYFDQLSAVAGPDGSLAVCGVAVPAWKATLPGAVSPPGRAYCATSRDGRRWRRPILIDRPADSIGSSDSIRTLLPAVAATPGVLWVTAYRVTADSTRVVLYRSRDAGASWAEVATLAARGFGRGGVRSLGATGAFDPGDYQGLAAAGPRLYAAFVLPAGDDPAGPTGLYVSRIELR